MINTAVLRGGGGGGVQAIFLPVDHRGLNGAPNCSSNHPNLPHIGFDGSRTNGIAVAACKTHA